MVLEAAHSSHVGHPLQDRATRPGIREVSTCRTLAEDPLEWTGSGGPSPSEIVDAAPFLQDASELARSVNPDPKALDAYGRKSAGPTLERAAQCIDEVIMFIPAGEEQITGAAFWSDESRAFREEEPVGSYGLGSR